MYDVLSYPVSVTSRSGVTFIVTGIVLHLWVCLHMELLAERWCRTSNFKENYLSPHKYRRM